MFRGPGTRHYLPQFGSIRLEAEAGALRKANRGVHWTPKVSHDGILEPMPPIQEAGLSPQICVLPGSWLSAEAKIWSNSFPDPAEAPLSQPVGGRKPLLYREASEKPKCQRLVWYAVMPYPVRSSTPPFTNITRALGPRLFLQNWKEGSMAVRVVR